MSIISPYRSGDDWNIPSKRILHRITCFEPRIRIATLITIFTPRSLTGHLPPLGYRLCTNRGVFLRTRLERGRRDTIIVVWVVISGVTRGLENNEPIPLNFTHLSQLATNRTRPNCSNMFTIQISPKVNSYSKMKRKLEQDLEGTFLWFLRHRLHSAFQMCCDSSGRYQFLRRRVYFRST